MEQYVYQVCIQQKNKLFVFYIADNQLVACWLTRLSISRNQIGGIKANRMLVG